MTLGLVPQRGRGKGRYSSNGRGGKPYRSSHQSSSNITNDGPTNNDDKFDEVKRQDELDEKMGFWRYREGPSKLGWLINMHPVSHFLPATDAHQ